MQQYLLRNSTLVPSLNTISRVKSLIDKSSKHMSTREYQMLIKFIEFIETNYDDSQIRAKDIAQSMCVSVRTMQSKVKAYIGLSPNTVLIQHRLDKAVSLIINNNDQISDIAYKTGFGDSNNFHKTFKKHYRIAPKGFRTRYRYH